MLSYVRVIMVMVSFQSNRPLTKTNVFYIHICDSRVFGKKVKRQNLEHTAVSSLNFTWEVFGVMLWLMTWIVKYRSNVKRK